MAPVRNARYVFSELPTDYPEPGKHHKYDDSPTIDLDTVPLEGGMLIKLLALAIDPYLRHRMRAPDATVYSYIPPFELNQPFLSHGVGVVLRSEDKGFAPGDYLAHAQSPHQEFFVAKNDFWVEKIPHDADVPLTHWIGILGIPGQTAYASWKEYAKPQKRQTVFVSSAAGAVGSIVVQLAKRDGMKVIASSGSEEKVKFVKECGADVSFNYKATSTEEVLKREGPIDVYYDNVGGEVLDLALKYSNMHARVIMCGMISDYNSPNKNYPYENMFNIISKSIQINGFLTAALMPRWGEEFNDVMPKLIREGQIKYAEDRSLGLDKVGQAMLDVWTGKNFGRKIVIIAQE